MGTHTIIRIGYNATSPNTSTTNDWEDVTTSSASTAQYIQVITTDSADTTDLDPYEYQLHRPSERHQYFDLERFDNGELQVDDSFRKWRKRARDIDSERSFRTLLRIINLKRTYKKFQKGSARYR